MKINWKLRLKNKATLTAILLAAIAFVYQILGIFGIVPSITESQLGNLVGIVANILVALGIITDPTTAGVCDSANALCYEEPKDDGKDDINE